MSNFRRIVKQLGIDLDDSSGWIKPAKKRHQGASIAEGSKT
jgi:hypothetical protein